MTNQQTEPAVHSLQSFAADVAKAYDTAVGLQAKLGWSLRDVLVESERQFHEAGDKHWELVCRTARKTYCDLDFPNPRTRGRDLLPRTRRPPELGMSL